MLEQHHRPAVRRTAAPGHAHPPRPRVHRRLSPQTRAALAETRLLPITCTGVPRGHASAPPLAFEAPVRLLPHTTAPATSPRTAPRDAPVVVPETRPGPPPLPDPAPVVPSPPSRHRPAPATRPSSRRQALATRQASRRSVWRVVAMVALLAGVVAIPRLSFAGSRTVTVSVDGEVRVRNTRAGTVGELLEQQGITVGPHDRVEPALEAAVHDDLSVAVRRGRKILVDVNGAVSREWVTAESTAGVLAELGLNGAKVEDGSVGDAALEVSHTWRLVVTHDGRAVEMATMATTVGEVLERAGIAFDADDEVSPPSTTPLDASVTEIKVVRVDRGVIGVHVALPAPVERRNDRELMRGRERVLREGRSGVRLDTFDVVYRDGVESERTLLGSEVLSLPDSRVIGVGTKAPRDGSAPTGRARAVPAGWTASHAREGRATWYQYKSGTCAHNTLPKGTLLRVTNLDNGRSTTCVVADRGILDPANMVDLAHDVFDDLAPRSQGVARVRIEW